MFNELLKLTGSSTISLESGEVERAPYLLSNVSNKDEIEHLSREKKALKVDMLAKI